jgi:hypothetical protein
MSGRLPGRREENRENELLGSGQNASVAGRPRKLTAALTEQLVFHVELGCTADTAARASGVAPRSVRRWRQLGQRELDALSPEALLALALNAAERRARTLLWRETARLLEELAAEPVSFDF